VFETSVFNRHFRQRLHGRNWHISTVVPYRPTAEFLLVRFDRYPALIGNQKFRLACNVPTSRTNRG